MKVPQTEKRPVCQSIAEASALSVSRPPDPGVPRSLRPSRGSSVEANLSLGCQVGQDGLVRPHARPACAWMKRRAERVGRRNSRIRKVIFLTGPRRKSSAEKCHTWSPSTPRYLVTSFGLAASSPHRRRGGKIKSGDMVSHDKEPQRPSSVP